jgi:class 3 adenylate cyclase/predicted ATPase
MDVGGWLRGLGLGEYEGKFRDNKIDSDVLADLTDGDLEKLGLPLGDRKRLLKAIAGLAGPPSAATRPEPANAQPLRPAATQSTSAERRPITVMFCDLVGSRALASRLDAEDWRSLVNAYLDDASGAVTGVGGYVLKRLGDGLMALFGYPRAQENDAELAVRAALAIQLALNDINARNAGKGAPQLSARIGLDSGPVVVEGTGEVFGEAPNIAARVQGLAEPGSVLVTANVQRQVAGLFVAEDKGAHELKGVPAPVTLYRIVRASGGRRTASRTLTPLVGREEELELLRRRWERARNGAGQLTLIVGEPGIGKSRLVEEFRAIRRSAFQEAIAHLGKAIAMADKTAGGKAAGASGEPRQLHVAYGNALIAARGYGAPETTKAFARARESVIGDNDAPQRLAADYGLWAGSYGRGELTAMRAHAETFLKDVEKSPDSPEAGIARRAAGLTHWFAGEYREAQQHLERALALFQPGRDDDLAFRFGQDAGIAAMLCLAFTLWPLGDTGRATSLVDDAEARIPGLAHIDSRAFGRMHAALFALIRGDPSRAVSKAAELARVTREHDLRERQAWGIPLEGLASAQSGTAGGGLEDLRRGVELLREHNVLLYDGLVKVTLAEVEARAGDVDRALAVLDEALGTCERTGHRAFEAELHRVRGEMLLNRDPANPAPAEEAFQTPSRSRRSKARAASKYVPRCRSPSFIN